MDRRCSSQAEAAWQVHCRQRAASVLAAVSSKPSSISSKLSRVGHGEFRHVAALMRQTAAWRRCRTASARRSARPAAGRRAGFFRVLPGNICVYGDRGPAAGGDGFHHRGGAGFAVSAGEDSVPAGDQGALVGLDGAPARQSAGVAQALVVHFLADGQDDRVGRDGEFGARHRFGPPSATGVGLAQLHLLTDHAGHLAVFTDHGEWRGEQRQVDAFLFGRRHFVDGGGHLLAGAAVDHGHFVRPQDGSTTGRRPWR